MSLSIDHAATLLRCSRRTVYNRIHEGKLRTIRVGNSTRVTIESIAQQPEFNQPTLQSLLSMVPIPHPRRIA
jgi:excisionase family DNA binding protein